MSQLAICKTIEEDMPDLSTVNKINDVNDSFNKNEDTFLKDETLHIDLEQADESITNHRLVALSGAITDKAYIINRPKMMIGRDQSAHIRVSEKSVSLCHAMICINGNECIIKDLNSRNGTLVNGRGVKNSKLRDGDKIRIGNLLFIFVSGRQSHSFWPLNQTWKNRIIKGMAVAGIVILAILVAIVRINSSTQQTLPVEKEDSIANNASGEERTTRSTQAASSSHSEQSISPEKKGLQLAEKALHYYINGNIALSIKLLEETLQLGLSGNSPLKAKVLAIKVKVVKIHDLYKKGLYQYQKNNVSQAIETWSEALIADREIVGQASSYFAGQIANYTGEIFHKMALQAYKKGSITQAQELCLQAFRAQPNNEGCNKIMNTIPSTKKISSNLSGN